MLDDYESDIKYFQSEINCWRNEISSIEEQISDLKESKEHARTMIESYEIKIALLRRKRKENR